MKDDMPPLGALKAFDAIVRHSSFKNAAAELLVTPTAVSHHIRQLEAHLGLKVLSRSPRAVALTPEGRVLHEAAASGFAEIRRAVTRIKGGGKPAPLTLSTTGAFLGHWLMARLPRLQKALPHTELRLHTSDAPAELGAGGIDAAIRYGKGPFPGAKTVPLKKDAFAPVASPALGLRRLADLRRTPLIHIEGRTRPRPLPDWARWCRHAGLSGLDTKSGLRFSDGLPAVQAAMAGQDAVIVSLVLVEDALASGLLVRPFAPALPGDTYHFAAAPGADPRIARLRDWFVENLR